MDHHQSDSRVSRRSLIAGAAGAALATGAVASYADVAGAAPGPRVGSAPVPAELSAPIAGLTYLPIDGLAFLPGPLTDGRVYQETTGVQPITPGRAIYAPLVLPAGSVIRQIHVAHVASPVITIRKRLLTAPNPPTQVFQQTTVAGTNPNTITFDLAAPVTIEAGALYYLDVFCSAGDSIFGLTIGYSAPLQGFVPFSGGNPRVLDTRVAGGKLGAGEDRTVSFASFGSAGARAVLFNLAVTETEGAGGFVGAYSAALPAWPENTSINWFGANQTLSNAVTSTLDSSGQIKLHGGASRTHVVIDVVGYLY